MVVHHCCRFSYFIMVRKLGKLLNICLKPAKQSRLYRVCKTLIRINLGMEEKSVNWFVKKKLSYFKKKVAFKILMFVKLFEDLGWKTDMTLFIKLNA